MNIKGLQKLTLLDFPGKVACTVFLGGCNMRCPFCHNATLVLGYGGEDISEEEFFSFLEKRRGRLEGVCISGGEPTLSPALPEFIRRIRSLGYAVKLDTNGLSPDMLEGLLREGLVDYVAMDIKSSREGYAKASGVPDIDLTKIEKSAALLMKSNTPYEFRTTVVRELHDEVDMVRIGEWLSGAKNYFLQSFLDSGELISDGLHGYDKKEMEHLLKLLKVKIPSAKIRG
nr:anaerobic ribonucleoside-triphosphate reductase activating protein [Clostridia bacterium]